MDTLLEATQTVNIESNKPEQGTTIPSGSSVDEILQRHFEDGVIDHDFFGVAFGVGIEWSRREIGETLRILAGRFFSAAKEIDGGSSELCEINRNEHLFGVEGTDPDVCILVYNADDSAKARLQAQAAIEVLRAS
ncbi:hypothetical protein KOR42_11440 [Thalassoglobus neptunius]|uniref:Uncharacterized protein n=2 Tax=Thalassoglobus neptunius TaxID=1938619 RepID=A0A5C5X4X4_9PLAN|nr:hypothetical protein KOR42_11440 [Thalassoglobus neptunius]